VADVEVARAAGYAVPADDVPFGRDQVAHGQQARRLGVLPELDDFPAELVADNDRGTEPVAGPGVPFPDMEIGAADAGVMHLDEDFVGAAGRGGNLPQFHPGAGGCLDQRAHGGSRLKGRGKGNGERRIASGVWKMWD
jgi:hypothetical protein